MFLVYWLGGQSKNEREQTALRAAVEELSTLTVTQQETLYAATFHLM